MANQNNAPETGTGAKRLPIAFVLDVSGSMLNDAAGRPRMDLLNNTLETIISMCVNDPTLRRCVEPSFLLFTDEVLLESRFRNVALMGEHMLPEKSQRHEFCGDIQWVPGKADHYPKEFMVPRFSVSIDDHGTNIGNAVLRGVRKLEAQIQAVKNTTSSYPAYIVLMTDGHPLEPTNPGYHDDLRSQNEAIQALLSHASTHRDENNLIVPFIVGIGGDEIDKSRLYQYANHFDTGYFHIRDEKAEEDWAMMQRILLVSVRASMTVSDLKQLQDRIMYERQIS